MTENETETDTNDIERQVKKRTLTQLNSIESMLRGDVSSNETIANYVQDCREELECEVDTDTDRSSTDET